MNRIGKFILILFLGVAILVFHLALAQAQERYNPLTGQVENVPTNSMLRYNPFSGTWNYASPNSVLKYNPIQDRWEITEPNAALRHNIYSGRWEYGEPAEWLQYNPFSNQWEYPVMNMYGVKCGAYFTGTQATQVTPKTAALQPLLIQ